MKYEICSANGYRALMLLEESVQEMVAKGWKPVGGVTLAYSERSGFYAAQAMVLEDNKEQGE